jgi:hypothetical protein
MQSNVFRHWTLLAALALGLLACQDDLESGEQDRSGLAGQAAAGHSLAGSAGQGTSGMTMAGGMGGAGTNGGGTSEGGSDGAGWAGAGGGCAGQSSAGMGCAGSAGMGGVAGASGSTSSSLKTGSFQLTGELSSCDVISTHEWAYGTSLRLDIVDEGPSPSLALWSENGALVAGQGALDLAKTLSPRCSPAFASGPLSLDAGIRWAFGLNQGGVPANFLAEGGGWLNSCHPQLSHFSFAGTVSAEYPFTVCGRWPRVAASHQA